MQNNTLKAYIVAVDMGYGHQRAAHPLIEIATTPEEWGISEPMIISANNYPQMAVADRNRWVATQKRYETISRMNSIPFFGKIIFKTMDYFQRIKEFYPKRDLSEPTLQSKRTYDAIKKGFGKHLIDVLNKNPLPLVCTFFIPAILAEGHGYKGKIYCLCTDTDISRAWVPYNVHDSKIIYLAPTIRVKERLQLYGIKKENIIVSGFPVPAEVAKPSALSKSLARRIKILDPSGIYQKQYKYLISSFSKKIASESVFPLTITFAVGGAGAQWQIGLDVLQSLKPKILQREIKLNLVAGTSAAVQQKFLQAIDDLGMTKCSSDSLEIIYDADKFAYFKKFNKTIIKTDILWTKPSELSFYAALGLPIVMAPALGSQERSNREWLQYLGAGFVCKEAQYTHEWLYDWLQSGCLAQAAVNGFLRIPRNSADHIKEIIFNNEQAGINNISL